MTHTQSSFVAAVVAVALTIVAFQQVLTVPVGGTPTASVQIA